jgi:hypothetical protein
MLQVAGCRLQVFPKRNFQTSTHDSSREHHQVIPDFFPLDVAKLNSFAQTFCAVASHSFARFTTAKDFWRVKERHSLRKTAEQKRTVYLAAALDQQARNVFCAELLQKPREIKFWVLSFEF